MANSEYITLAKKLRMFARYAIGRVTGTTLETDGNFKFFTLLEEGRLAHRAELNALSKILISKKVFTQKEWGEFLTREMRLMAKEQTERWPDITVDHDGSGYIIRPFEAAKRMKEERWPP